MKIPFDIKYRPQIESGEYKVETRDGKPARIVCWDRKSIFNQNLLVLLDDGNAGEFANNYRKNGMLLESKETRWDLFIVIPEPELSEDERIRKAIGAAICGTTAENVLEANGVRLTDALTYLEKQKEYIEDIRQYAYNKGLVDAEEKQKPLSTEETELNSIAFLEQLGYTCVPPGGEQKPAEWSKEDKGALEDAICATDILGNDESFNKSNPNLAKAFRVAKVWLKTLPERFNLQPKQEWSDEDETVLDALIRRIEGEDIYVSPHLVVKCLKSLRHQYHWKPSKEQMEALRISYKIGTANESWAMRVLETLYSDLKNL